MSHAFVSQLFMFMKHTTLMCAFQSEKMWTSTVVCSLTFLFSSSKTYFIYFILSKLYRSFRLIINNFFTQLRLCTHIYNVFRGRGHFWINKCLKEGRRHWVTGCVDGAIYNFCALNLQCRLVAVWRPAKCAFQILILPGGKQMKHGSWGVNISTLPGYPCRLKGCFSNCQHAPGCPHNTLACYFIK